ncbi:MAG: hypothetical protein PHQ23_04245, partial [Candidatus Wallbacteria bacterium]|nr:hypothetical protein [Candidatus Wallbacteria bacterium]
MERRPCRRIEEQRFETDLVTAYRYYRIISWWPAVFAILGNLIAVAAVTALKLSQGPAVVPIWLTPVFYLFFAANFVMPSLV